MTSTELTPRAQLEQAAISFKTAADAARFFESIGAAIADNEADGIRNLDVVEKERLIGVPFIMMSWRFHESDTRTRVDENGNKVSVWFASVEYITQDGRQGVFNDGSTGIFTQLRDLTDRRNATGHAYPTMGRAVGKGLRVSRYEIETPDGGTEPAATFYLDF